MVLVLVAYRAWLVMLILMTICSNAVYVKSDPIAKEMFGAIEIEMIENGLLVTSFHLVLLAALLPQLCRHQGMADGRHGIISCSTLSLNIFKHVERLVCMYHQPYGQRVIASQCGDHDFAALAIHPCHVFSWCSRITCAYMSIYSKPMIEESSMCISSKQSTLIPSQTLAK